MAEMTILNHRYQLMERLGSGGMATVYRARDLTLERMVAIKILRKDYSNDPAFRRRFHQEAKAAAGLSHPNIVTIHDFGLYADELFIVMEYVAGVELKTLIKERGVFELKEALNLEIQACAGIGYAHRRGLVHCDVKPQNMLVTNNGVLKVVDFGIARALAAISPDEKSDVVWGSPQYFSPEQAAGSAPSPASDVYSLGVVLFEMTAGRLPFIANDANQLALLHRDALPPSPRKFNPAIPAPLEQIILKVLAKPPSARYRSADQLGAVLESFRQQMAQGDSFAHAAAPPPTLLPQGGKAPQISAPAWPSAAYPSPRPPARPASRPAPYTQPLDEQTPYLNDDAYPDDEVVIITSARSTQGFDWLTWMLALAALIAVGGLIPFWFWVFYILRPLM
jgi:serine/threonine-protein kinase